MCSINVMIKSSLSIKRRLGIMKAVINILLVLVFSLVFGACTGSGGSTSAPAGDLSSKTFEELRAMVLEGARKCGQESTYTNNIDKTQQDTSLNETQKKNSLINMKQDLDNSNCG